VAAAEAVEGPALAFEREETGERAARELARVVAALPAQDHLILKMRFQDGFGINEIARALHLEERPLYRRIEQLLKGLRRELEAAGVRADEVEEIVNRGEWPSGTAFPGTQPVKADGASV
jgi:RNA polymerase sigma factor for flagellar operon FliA